MYIGSARRVQYNSAMNMIVTSATMPSDAELAALSVAVVSVLAERVAEPATTVASNTWQASAKLSRQGLRPARTGIQPRWVTIERLRRRAAGGFYGITGL